MTTLSRNSTSPSTPRSIISRLTSPFTSKTRNVSDFHIQTDEPHRQYTPGDVVKGSVFLTVHKPVRITHIVVCLHGYVRVYRNAIAPGEGISRESGFLGVGRGRRGTEYFGNGFASLFEDELVLCGEGRLNIGIYVFKFALRFPSVGIPTSIDFERGTISYMLTSTLTRPTTIAPVSTCDRKIYLIEAIDIAPLRQPKPRVITLEPISKLSRPKHSVKKSPTLSDIGTITNESNISEEDRPESSDSTVAQLPDEPPRSPAPSDISTVSAVSSSNVSVRLGGVPPNSKIDKGSTVRSSSTSVTDRTITATTELLRGGCLPGDSIPIKITIDHTKPVKSLQGVIITLYRVGRIDTHPAIPLGPSQNGKKPVYEDYYPRSRTGLSGLSLSSAGSSHVYRMDLAQTFAPLIIDPVSLSSIIKTSIHVPEDVFPTISSVPGAMISFSYYVEVVIDLRGKLASQDRFLPRLGMTTASPSTGYNNPPIGRRAGMGDSTPLNGSNIEETDRIRREKSVVVCLFEVIVGTRDSERIRARRTEEENIQYSPVVQDEIDGPAICEREVQGLPSESPSQGHAGHEPQNDALQPEAQHILPHRQELVPPPQVEEGLDEKTQLRRAEERLLPSSPPLDDDCNSMTMPFNLPSAPTAHELHDEFRVGGPNAPAYLGSSAPSNKTIVPLTSNATPHGEHDTVVTAESAAADNMQDDKQELERRRLLTEASAPGGPSFRDEAESSSLNHDSYQSPSAPAFNENDEYQLNNPQGAYSFSPSAPEIPDSHGSTEVLPQYQK